MTIYAYLDAPGASLPDRQRALLTAMRAWVAAARSGRCACGEVRAALADVEAGEGARDLGIAMATLDRDALARLRFGDRSASLVTDDEGRLLALFDAARAGQGERVRRMAASLVSEAAVPRLVAAARYVAAHLACGVDLERDR